jgi:fermentation-respiration switch protein FrsA (DUF1100 family)
MKKCFLSAVIILQSVLCLSQTSKSIVGEWSGKLKMQGVALRIVLHIEEKNGVLITTMDSPDQGVNAIPTESTVFSENEIMVKLPALQAQFKGILEDSMNIRGIFTQRGMDLPLELLRQMGAEKKTVAPQDPNAGKYTSTDVRFKNQSANITLAGTVTYPKEKINYPAVILLTGSGAQDRDESLFGQKPFLRIADRLSANGIAVLRFDDRGFAQSEGDIKTATTYDFVTDALAAYEFLKNYPGIDTSKIGFIGHSEGAGVAVMAAAENKTVAYVIMLAGIAISGDSLLNLQSAAIMRAAGTDQRVIDADYKMRSGVYNIVKNESDSAKASVQIAAHIQSLDDLTEVQKQEVTAIFTKTVLVPWMRSFLSYDPGSFLAKVDCPVVAFFGEKDLQVPAKENAAALTDLIYKNKKHHFSIVNVDGVNHLFQNAQTGLVSEYSNTEEAMMNDVTLDKLQDWLQNYSLK